MVLVSDVKFRNIRVVSSILDMAEVTEQNFDQCHGMKCWHINRINNNKSSTFDIIQILLTSVECSTPLTQYVKVAEILE